MTETTTTTTTTAAPSTAPAPVYAYVILAPSARGFRNCLLGQGATEREAWLDAFGPSCNGRKPKGARNPWCEGVTWEELDALHEAMHN